MSSAMPTDLNNDIPPGVAAPALPPLEVGGGGVNATQLLLQIQAGQSHQTDLITKLSKQVVTARTMINELVLANNEMKEELQKMRSAAQCDACKQKEAASQVDHLLSVAVAGSGQTTDAEIDAILENRKRKQSWPVKHSTLNCFSVQQDLVKLRFHHSEKYQHVPVRIPKTDKNKDGTKPCKLCSEGKVRRKTTWMCAVCEVPLCTRPLMDEPGSSQTHHTMWHSERDLISAHKKCFSSLKDGRESRKRARADVEGEAAGGEGPVSEEVATGEQEV